MLWAELRWEWPLTVSEELRQLTEADTFSLTNSSWYSRQPIAALQWFFPSIVIIISVFLNTSYTLSFLPGLAIIHHFLSFGEKPKSGPRLLKMSHHFLISVVESVPPASSANEYCFAVDTICILVIKGWILGAHRAIVIESPCVVPSALWQDPLSADDKLILVSKSWSRK